MKQKCKYCGQETKFKTLKEYIDHKYEEYIKERIRITTEFQDWFETGVYKR